VWLPCRGERSPFLFNELFDAFAIAGRRVAVMVLNCGFFTEHFDSFALAGGPPRLMRLASLLTLAVLRTGKLLRSSLCSGTGLPNASGRNGILLFGSNLTCRRRYAVVLYFLPWLVSPRTTAAIRLKACVLSNHLLVRGVKWMDYNPYMAA
jgi:hypothetical protein